VLDEGTERERRCDYCGGRGFVPDDENDDGGVLQTLKARPPEVGDAFDAGRQQPRQWPAHFDPPPPAAETVIWSPYWLGLLGRG
jgi:hypothetical protein